MSCCLLEVNELRRRKRNCGKFSARTWTLLEFGDNSPGQNVQLAPLIPQLPSPTAPGQNLQLAPLTCRDELAPPTAPGQNVPLAPQTVGEKLRPWEMVLDPDHPVTDMVKGQSKQPHHNIAMSKEFTDKDWEEMMQPSDPKQVASDVKESKWNTLVDHRTIDFMSTSENTVKKSHEKTRGESSEKKFEKKYKHSQEYKNPVKSYYSAQNTIRWGLIG